MLTWNSENNEGEPETGSDDRRVPYFTLVIEHLSHMHSQRPTVTSMHRRDILNRNNRYHSNAFLKLFSLFISNSNVQLFAKQLIFTNSALHVPIIVTDSVIVAVATTTITTNRALIVLFNLKNMLKHNYL